MRERGRAGSEDAAQRDAEEHEAFGEHDLLCRAVLEQQPEAEASDQQRVKQPRHVVHGRSLTRFASLSYSP